MPNSILVKRAVSTRRLRKRICKSMLCLMLATAGIKSSATILPAGSIIITRGNFSPSVERTPPLHFINMAVREIVSKKNGSEQMELSRNPA
ncbi:MAG: hypothetical protein ABIX01_12965 [Chitinophagaceae bacterium]